MISNDNNCIRVTLDESNIVQHVGISCTFTGCYGDMGAVGFDRTFPDAFVHVHI